MDGFWNFLSFCLAITVLLFVGGIVPIPIGWLRDRRIRRRDCIFCYPKPAGSEMMRLRTSHLRRLCRWHQKQLPSSFRRDRRNCPVCTSSMGSLILTDYRAGDLCWMHGEQHDRIGDLERELGLDG